MSPPRVSILTISTSVVIVTRFLAIGATVTNGVVCLPSRRGTIPGVVGESVFEIVGRISADEDWSTLINRLGRGCGLGSDNSLHSRQE